ncbi:MAG TPA: PorV/PorQ family protein [Elusimicrobiota bacterium]|nr:PorV/PorQ family protein [Elusimicrobiota bacterium]
MTGALVIFTGLFLSLKSSGFAGNGSASAQFLKLPTDTRGAAMGEAFGAAATGAASQFWNPAGLVHADALDVNFTHVVMLDDMAYSSLGAATGLKNNGAIALQLSGLTQPAIDVYDVMESRTGSTITPSDQMIAIGLAKRIKRVPVGVNFKWLQSSLGAANASGLAGDAGILIESIKNMRFGIGLQNFGQKIKYDAAEEPLPLKVYVASAYARPKIFMAVAQLESTRENSLVAKTGIETKFQIEKSIISLRGGISSENVETGGLAMLRLGFGVAIKYINVDYTWAPVGELGDIHWIGMGFRYGGTNSTKP